MERVICLAIGYVFGLFQTAFIYGKMNHIDIREHGSGNAGTTNALRVLGKKAGLIVFLGDAGKMIVACLLTRLLFRSQPEMLYVYLLYTGFGVILGHNFPFYMGFKGGKGIAASAGLLASTDWRVMLVCLVVFVAAVAITRYVSLGSMAAYAGALVCFIGFGAVGSYGMDFPHTLEMDVIMGLMTALAIYRHRANIYRLLNGTENKLGAAKTAAK